MINKNFKDNLNEIVDLYFNKKFSIKQISKKFYIPTTTLHRNLKKSGIELRSFAEGVRLFHNQNQGVWKGRKNLKLSIILKGHKISKEARIKISNSLKKSWKKKEIREKFVSGFLKYYETHANPRKGKKNSKVTREKISKSLKAAFQSKKSKTLRLNCSKGGKIGGPKAVKVQRERKPYYFMNVPFDSNEERALAKLFHKYKIINKFIDGKNCHVLINSSIFDFLIKNKKLFVEYHPWDRNGSLLSYVKKRKSILKKNGYLDDDLIVLKSLKDFREKILSLFNIDETKEDFLANLEKIKKEFNIYYDN